MKSLLFAVALTMSGTAMAQSSGPMTVEHAADSLANAPTRLGANVTLCSKTQQDECMNPSKAPHLMMHREHSEKHATHLTAYKAHHKTPRKLTKHSVKRHSVKRQAAMRAPDPSNSVKMMSPVER
jgi:hypothetical protein